MPLNIHYSSVAAIIDLKEIVITTVEKFIVQVWICNEFQKWIPVMRSWKQTVLACNLEGIGLVWGL